MRRVITTEGDGLPVYRRASRERATAEIHIPHINPAGSPRDGAGVRIGVQFDGTWEAALLTPYRASHPSPLVARKTILATGNLTNPTRSLEFFPTPLRLDAHENPITHTLIKQLAADIAWTHILDLNHADRHPTPTDTASIVELGTHLAHILSRSPLLVAAIREANPGCDICARHLGASPSASSTSSQTPAPTFPTQEGSQDA